jgi:hypothetical protein
MYAFMLAAAEAGGPFCFGIYRAWETSLPSAELMNVCSAMINRNSRKHERTYKRRGWKRRDRRERRKKCGEEKRKGRSARSGVACSADDPSSPAII